MLDTISNEHDRAICMTCNEPPWYKARRRQRIIERFWPLIFIGGIGLIYFCLVWAIVLYQRWFG